MTEITISLPHAPGVYLMRDYSGEVIYIGKAKDLAKRVASYFSKTLKEPKINALLSSIRTVDYIIAVSENDALLLENRLIKKIKPKYNVIWRDDKSYPYIGITLKENYPRICLIRKQDRDGEKLFGPYANSGDVRRLLQYLVKTYNIRTCKHELKGVKSNGAKYQSCMYYQVKQCPAPCLDKIKESDYRRNIKKVRLFLEGRYLQLKNQLERDMYKSSSAREYEKAIKLRNNIKAIDRMFERIRFHEIREEELTENLKVSRGLSMLKHDLNLPGVPLIIEAFDISNIQGTASVGSMVRFFQGKPDKKNYRKYKIKSVNGIDDYSMMKEIIQRRYNRLLRENRELPDLVVIDGGRGHVEVARKVLAEMNLKRLPVISLAKNEEKIYLPDKTDPLDLTKDSPSLHILQHIRDEAHRFALKYHKQKRKLSLN